MSDSFIPYSRHTVDEEDISAVVRVLRSDWLTTGPAVDAFEQALAAYLGDGTVVAVSSGTAALHAAIHACDIGPGDEVIVPAMTFAASANCVVYEGGQPVFADVCRDTLLLDPASVMARITPRTKAIVAVDYAGQACDYDALADIAHRYGLRLIADSCHALGATYRGRPVGTLADFSVFSFHPVKHITAGEGGAVVARDPENAVRLRRFRNHGINADHRQRQRQGTWFYAMEELGFNYRIPDILCALCHSQLAKLPVWLEKRDAIVGSYDEAFGRLTWLAPLRTAMANRHAHHLYVVLLDLEQLTTDRRQIFQHLREMGIGVNVHYVPVHLHPYYRRRFGYAPGICPVAEQAYERMLSLPLYPAMTDVQVERVIGAVQEVGEKFAREVANG